MQQALRTCSKERQVSPKANLKEAAPQANKFKVQKANNLHQAVQSNHSSQLRKFQWYHAWLTCSQDQKAATLRASLASWRSRQVRLTTRRKERKKQRELSSQCLMNKCLRRQPLHLRYHQASKSKRPKFLLSSTRNSKQRLTKQRTRSKSSMSSIIQTSSNVLILVSLSSVETHTLILSFQHTKLTYSSFFQRLEGYPSR